MKHNIVPLTLILFFVFCGCKNSSEVFLEFKPLDKEGWSKNEIISFDVPITDIASTYNIYLIVRNTEQYPYQNFWVFTDEFAPETELSVKDTIECYLADNRGKWLGSGIGSVYEMPVLWQQNIKFEKAGTYTFRFTHGMRIDVLRGVKDIGLKVEKSH